MTTDVLVIGGGQAGLAMSRCLNVQGIEHRVIERGRIGERWRSERWDSLRLLTPNWMSRLPDYQYAGPDPDGFMTMPEVVSFLEDYGRTIGVPIQEDTCVEHVTRAGGGFVVRTSRGTLQTRAVVVATGYCDQAAVPAMAARLAPSVVQMVPRDYRRPDQLPDGGVLVVGASATGIQLADEVHASGRPVTLAVGHHLRLPRRYRGRDILWWFDRMGLLEAGVEDVHDIEISKHQPSMQLVGRPDHATLSLPLLEAQGVRLTGRVAGIDGTRIHLADDLVAYTAGADIKLAMLRRRIDQYIAASGLDDVEPPDEFEPFCWPAVAPETIDLQAEGIRTVVWATGYRRSYPWLDVPVVDRDGDIVPVVDRDGDIVHAGGVTPVAGLYVLGLQFLRRRNSAFIDGVGADARDLAAHVASLLRVRTRAAVSA
jgi:putative flavoprotein involved in K+ transport